MPRFRCWLCILFYAAVALGIHVVPLLPHHHVLERSRKERRQLVVDDLQIDPLYQGIGVRELSLFPCSFAVLSSFSLFSIIISDYFNIVIRLPFLS